MQNGLFTSTSHSCYVTIYDRHAGDGINRSRNQCGIFDIDSKRIHGKYLQLKDIRHTASATANKSERRDKEQMTFDKLPSSSLARSGSVLSALVIATFLFAGSFTTVQQTSATIITEEEQDVLDTQDAATENLSESDRDVNGIEFTPRWGAVSTLEPNQIKVLFADCLEDEFAVSSMYMFESSEVIGYQSFPVAFDDDTMTWLAVVKNTDTNDARVASIGVICADENDGDDREDDINIDIRTKTIIQNTANNFINVVNNNVVNLNAITNVYQTITQNSYQVAIITGNNNTVNQVVQQTATQILNANTTNPAVVQQSIDQAAEQRANVTGGGTVEQDVDQDADQAANVTGGGTVDQDVDQDADQAANVTGGGTVDQDVDQDADQAANVTGGGTVDQDVDQD